MKILYDHQAFNMQKKGGVSRYFYGLIKGLRTIKDVECDLALLYSDNQYINSFKTVGVNRSTGNSKKNNTINFLKTKLRKFKLILSIYDVIKNRGNMALSLKKIKNGDFDIFHPTYYDPYFLDYLGKKPFVLTVHDMIHEIFPDYFSAQDKTRENKAKLAVSANQIIAISENTKQDIIKYLGVDPSKITVVHHANFLDVSREEKIKTPARYILYVGGRKRWKNFIFFINSIAGILKDENDLSVFCVGGGGFDVEEIRLFSDLLIKDMVIQRDVIDSQLVYLYKHAEFFIFPSVYEGFGIPILEAFACGCPAIISNASCFPEIAEEAALYFDPKSEASLVSAVKGILSDSTLKDEMIKKGFKRSEDFSENKIIMETLEVYKKTLEKS